MQVERKSAPDGIWIKPHLNRKGNMVKGHWRTRPRVIRVKGHFRDFNFVKPYKRRRPVPASRVAFILAGQPESFEHTLINILRDVEPLMGY
ncbi:MAG: hypothetical protein O2783_04385 [Chloroflexi bacterium]|nr:hypothetical protein [Chloroflexota bacterium]